MSAATAEAVTDAPVDAGVDRAGVARVVFLITVPTERTEQFLAAYETIRHEVADGVPGHLVDQVCRSDEDPEQWLITSEWRSLAHFRAWEATPGHRELAAPMRAAMTGARSLKFDVVRQTRGRSAPTEEKRTDHDE